MDQSVQPSCQQKEIVILPSYQGGACCPSGADEPASGRPRLDQDFVTGSVSTPAGSVPQVSAQLQWRDHWGAIKARWGVGRMDYAIDPGLYALGNPDRDAAVLVSANYKMSFDELRSALSDRDCWILVLDTKGINVWCAAGKGTFGTEELVRRIEASSLTEVVSHRSLILPQLGAPGVAAHTVRKRSGFTVRYGPIRARDLIAFIDAGFQATPEMRLKTFTLRERAVLIPLEFVEAMRPSLIIAPILFILGGIGGHSGFWANALQDGSFAVLAFMSGVIGGTVVNPLLLPYLPGRAFAAKGLWLGAIIAIIVLAFGAFDGSAWSARLAVAGWLLIIPAVTAYLAMNFTGCSTYTSLSGVNREMRWALPVEIGMGLCGLLIWTASRLVA